MSEQGVQGLRVFDSCALTINDGHAGPGLFARYFFIVIYLFNSLFTVDFSMVITTNLHRLTENFIIKRKI